MENLIKQIEQWAEDRNIINGTKPIDQAMKLFSEFGELADNVGKGRDCRDDIGDVFVVLTIITKQCERRLFDYIDGISAMLRHPHNKECVSELANHLSNFVSWLTIPENFNGEKLIYSVKVLMSICENSGYTLSECLEIAYNDIKDRKGVVYNGLFIKESDPAYAEALIKLGKA